MRQIRVLCTSVGNDGFPSIVDSLHHNKQIEIIGCDADPNAPGLSLSKKGYVIPFRDDETNLLHRVKEIIDAEKVDILLPLSTDDQLFYAKNRSFFENTKVKMAVSSFESVSLANHKHKFYEFCKRHGFPIPHYKIIQSASSMLELLHEYKNRQKVCVIKKSHGTGAQGVKVIDPKMSSSSRFWSRDNIRISYEDAIPHFTQNNSDFPLMVSDYLPGTHVSVDALLTPEGQFIAVARTEEKHIYGMGTFGRTIDEPKLLEHVYRLGKKMGLTYCYNVEFKMDSSGDYKLLEVNPRFAASLGHTVLHGVNIPELLIEYLMGTEKLHISTRENKNSVTIAGRVSKIIGLNKPS